jgi:hypothetical protein
MPNQVCLIDANLQRGISNRSQKQVLELGSKNWVASNFTYFCSSKHPVKQNSFI